MTRRFLCCTLAALCLYSIFPCRILAVETSAASAILMDADSGRVLYERNADRKMLIASTTKILTALVAIEEGDLHDSVKVSREAAYTEGSAMYLTEGETLTLETLLYGVLPVFIVPCPVRQVVVRPDLVKNTGDAVGQFPEFLEPFEHERVTVKHLLTFFEVHATESGRVVHEVAAAAYKGLHDGFLPFLSIRYLPTGIVYYRTRAM